MNQLVLNLQNQNKFSYGILNHIKEYKIYLTINYQLFNLFANN